jgi:hypothetical protein
MGKLFEELKELKAQYDKKLKKDGESAVKEAFKDFFYSSPKSKVGHLDTIYSIF